MSTRGSFPFLMKDKISILNPGECVVIGPVILLFTFGSQAIARNNTGYQLDMESETFVKYKSQMCVQEKLSLRYKTLCPSFNVLRPSFFQNGNSRRDLAIIIAEIRPSYHRLISTMGFLHWLDVISMLSQDPVLHPALYICKLQCYASLVLLTGPILPTYIMAWISNYIHNEICYFFFMPSMALPYLAEPPLKIEHGRFVLSHGNLRTLLPEAGISGIYK